MLTLRIGIADKYCRREKIRIVPANNILCAYYRLFTEICCLSRGFAAQLRTNFAVNSIDRC